MNIVFYPTIPNPPDAPKNDVLLMQMNSAGANLWPTVDHIGYNNPLGGYHNLIHLIDQSNPTLLANVAQLYSNTVSGATQLFYNSAAGILTQLTGPNASKTASGGFGYVWMPGPLLVQWGFVGDSGSPIPMNTFQPVLFDTKNINFPTNIFGIVTQLYSNNSIPNGNANVSIQESTIGLNGFSWVNVTDSNRYNGFYWLAWGN